MVERPDIDFRALAREAGDLLCVATMAGVFLWVNRRGQEVLGWTFEELTTQPFIDLVHPEDVQPTMAEMGKLG